MTDKTNDENWPRPTTLAEVRDLAAIPVFSTDGPSWAGIMRVSKWTAYNLSAKKQIPGLIKIGRLYRVAVPELRRELGDLPSAVAKAE